MRNMKAHDNVILLTCGLRRPRVSRERRGSNLDREFFLFGGSHDFFCTYAGIRF
jgi:hypothetical protein